MAMQLTTRAAQHTEVSTPDDLPGRSRRSSGMSGVTSCSSEILMSERLIKRMMSMGPPFSCHSLAGSTSTLSLEPDINNSHAKRVSRRIAPILLAAGCWIDGTNDGREAMIRAHNSVTLQQEGITVEVTQERGSVTSVSLPQSSTRESSINPKDIMRISDYSPIGSESDLKEYLPPTENDSARRAIATYTGGAANMSPEQVPQEDNLDQNSGPPQGGKGKQKSVSYSFPLQNHTDNDDGTGFEDSQADPPLPGAHTQVVALRTESQTSMESKQTTQTNKNALPTQQPTTSTPKICKPDKTKVSSPKKAEDSKVQKISRLENTKRNSPTTIDRQKPLTGNAKIHEKITQSPDKPDEPDDSRGSGPRPSGAEKQKSKSGAVEKKGQGSGKHR